MEKKYKLFLISLFGVFVVLAGGKGVFSQESDAPTAKASGENASIKNRETVITLSEKEVIAIALANSLDIQIAKFGLYQEQTSLLKTQSIFDAFLAADVSYYKDTTKPSFSFSASKTTVKEFNSSLSKLLPSGTLLGISVGESRTASNSLFSNINPSYDTSVGLSVSQALGKNFFGIADRAQIKITKKMIQNREFTALTAIEDTIYQVLTAYWTLVLRNEELAIVSSIRDQAKTRYIQYQEKFRLGLVEQGDLYAVESNLHARESEVVAAQLLRDVANSNLLFLINKGDIDVLAYPQERLMKEIVPLEYTAELQTAINSRRDYQILKQQLEVSNIELEVKENALFPEIDFSASLVRNGLDRKYPKSWQDLTDENYAEAYVGVSFKVPLENRGAHADYQRESFKNQELLFALKRTERLIMREIYEQVKTASSTARQIELYETVVALQTNKLAEELKRFTHGRSNADTIIRYEEDVLQSRINLARLLFQYRMDIYMLERKKNTLLDKYWEGSL